MVLKAAADALAAKDYKRAHELCLRALEADPGCAEAYFLLGLLTAEHQNYAKALDLFDRAIACGPAAPNAHAHRGRVLLALSRHEEASLAADAAAGLRPKDALTLDTIGVVYSRTGRHEIAIGFFEDAIQAGDAAANIHYNLAAARQFMGDFDGAAAAYARALQRDPMMAKAYSGLAQLRKQTPEQNYSAELEALFAKTLDPDGRLHIGHALAKTYEDLGRPEQAFDWLIKAKQAKRVSLGYEFAEDEAYFAAARAAAPKASTPGYETDAPIFIVGLPRTGTTLLDRILSSHPEIVSAGELTAFSLLTKRMAGTASALVLDAPTLIAASQCDPQRLGAAYMDFVTARIRPAARFVDKMPLNFFYAGLINQALPNARIICLRRHPLDACLSNFRQLFATSFAYYNYAFNLQDTARYYIEFDRLMNHWRSVLPDSRFIETSYEDLVADIEGETRRLMSFIGLDFDPRCIDFHENAAPVATASAVQVRQKLYATSIGRWRKYVGLLAEAAQILFSAGILSEEDFAAAQ